MGRELQRDYGQKPQIVLMTPILEGMDGVQKMSKSLNNAIGINEPASEMYGKLMSISDELMWKYWVLLTDVPQSEVNRLRDQVANGGQHPMAVKVNLAFTIVSGFHSREETIKAADDWGRMHRQNEIPDEVERVTVSVQEIGWQVNRPLRLDRLLVAMGLASSNSEAQRKIKEGALEIKGVGTRVTLYVPLTRRQPTCPRSVSGNARRLR